MDAPLLNTTKPKCLRCSREVDSATSQSVTVNRIPGFRLTYRCHGDEESHDITAEWHEKLTTEKKPFVETVFKPLLEEPVAPVDDVTLKLREHRKLIAEFVETTIKAVVETQPTYKGTDLATWCAMRNLRLESLYSDVIDHARDVRRLVVGSNTVLGIFELPFFPDGAEKTWTPTVVPEKKAKK